MEMIVDRFCFVTTILTSLKGYKVMSRELFFSFWVTMGWDLRNKMSGKNNKILASLFPCV
jgi:hypothetical protein